jgi:hypothetical protein
MMPPPNWRQIIDGASVYWSLGTYNYSGLIDSEFQSEVLKKKKLVNPISGETVILIITT